MSSTIEKAMAKLRDSAHTHSQDEEKENVTLQQEAETEPDVNTEQNRADASQAAFSGVEEEKSEAAHSQFVQETIEEAPSMPAEKRALQGKYANIDTDSLNKRGFVTKNSSERAMKEQFRAVKRKLLSNAFGPLSRTLRNPNLVIISSCNPHEGKTFTAINLALNIALEQDKTVLLVDADIVRPSIARELNQPSTDGLTEYLLGKMPDISECIHSTNIDNFKYIPAGIPHELSTELLASERMTSLTEELASRYSDRIVIFDAPPLLGVNETHVMANLVGQALIVVEENKTKLTDVKAAVDQLDKDLAVGFLLNKSRKSWRDYYGYGYGYGYYHSDG